MNCRRFLTGPAFRPLRVVILVVLAFLLTDVFLERGVRARFDSGLFRLPEDTSVLLDEFIEYLGSRPERIVCFLGDSTVQGRKLADEQTVPVRAAKRFAGDARGVRTANLGMTAGKITDAFYVTARLHVKRGDAAVFNINYKNFGEYDLGVPLRFKNLYQPALDKYFTGDISRELKIAGDEESRGTASFAASLARSHWFFLRNRDLVNARLFGLHPRKMIKSYFNFAAQSGLASIVRRLRREGAPKKDWTGTQWDPWAVDVLRRYYKVGPLDDTNPSFRFIGPASALARDRGLVAAWFLNPMNRELCDRFGIIDWHGYRANVERIQRAVTDNGAVLWDYTDLLSSGDFIDNDHLTPSGADKLAARLADDLRGLPDFAEGGR